MRGRQVAPSGMVPRPPQDVIPSPLMSVSVASGSSVSVPGPLPPSLGQVSDPVDRMHDQSRVRSATGIALDKVNFDNVSALVTPVSFAPSVSTSFDPSAPLFPSSVSGFPSRDFPGLPSYSYSAASLPPSFSAPSPLSSLAPSVSVFSLPSVVPSVLSSSALPSFSAPQAPLPSVSFLLLLHILLLFLCLLPPFLLLQLLLWGSLLLLLFLSPPLLLFLPFRLLLLGRSLLLLLSLLWPLLRGSLRLLLLLLLPLGILRSFRRVFWGCPRSIRRWGAGLCLRGVPISLHTCLLTSLIFTLIFVLTFLLALPVFFPLWPHPLLFLLLLLLFLRLLPLPSWFLPFLFPQFPRLRLFSLLLLCLLLFVLLLLLLLRCLLLSSGLGFGASSSSGLFFFSSCFSFLGCGSGGFRLGSGCWCGGSLFACASSCLFYLLFFFFFSFPAFCCRIFGSGLFSSGSFRFVFVFRLSGPFFFFFCLCSVCPSG